jgi:hypothetical protein
MSYGSYYQSTPNYYRNPVPYTHSDIGAPVPGWGTSVRVAGPARVGVGATRDDFRAGKTTDFQRVYYGPVPDEGDVGDGGDGTADDALEEAGKVGGVDWYVWPIAAAVLLAGVGYYGTTKGWF